MYYEYWGLKKPAFDNVPDPSMYVDCHASMENAIAEALFAIEEGDECIAVIVGDVGLGKTMSIRMIIDSLDQEKYKIVLITNPGISFVQLLQEIIGQLTGKQCDEKRKVNLLEMFNQELFSTYEEGKKILIFIDEANAITPINLENLRLLTNMQGDRRNLFTMVLAGQNEFAKRLEHPKRANLFQRVGSYSRIDKLDSVEKVRTYAETRLMLAGATRKIFTDDSFGALWEQSDHGVPRLVNKLSKLCLKAGETNSFEFITGEIVDQIGSRFHKLAGPAIQKRRSRRYIQEESSSENADEGEECQAVDVSSTERRGSGGVEAVGAVSVLLEPVAGDREVAEESAAAPAAVGEAGSISQELLTDGREAAEGEPSASAAIAAVALQEGSTGEPDEAESDMVSVSPEPIAEEEAVAEEGAAAPAAIEEAASVSQALRTDGRKEAEGGPSAWADIAVVALQEGSTGEPDEAEWDMVSVSPEPIAEEEAVAGESAAAPAAVGKAESISQALLTDGREAAEGEPSASAAIAAVALQEGSTGEPDEAEWDMVSVSPEPIAEEEAVAEEGAAAPAAIGDVASVSPELLTDGRKDAEVGSSASADIAAAAPQEAPAGEPEQEVSDAEAEMSIGQVRIKINFPRELLKQSLSSSPEFRFKLAGGLAAEAMKKHHHLIASQAIDPVPIWVEIRDFVLDRMAHEGGGQPRP